MKLKGLFVLCLVIILACFVGCEQNFNKADTGSLSLSFSKAKNIIPDTADITIATYEVTGVLSTDAAKTFSKTGLTDKTVTVDNLLVGTWNIVAKGYNASGTLIAQSSSTPVVIAKDQTTASTLALSYLTDGNGSLSYSISWSKNIDQIMGFQIEIEGRSPITLSITDAALTGNVYKLTGTQDDIPTGQHDMEIQALDADNHPLGQSIEEKLDVYKDLTSAYDLTLNEGLYPPNTPSFSVEPGEVALNKTLTISTQTPEAVIYYTTDTSDPATSPTKTLYSAPVVIDQTMVIKAVAVLNDRLSSNVASRTYTVRRADCYKIIKSDLKILQNVLHLENPTITEPKTVGWKINGEAKTGETTLAEGVSLVTAIITAEDKELCINSIITLEASEQVQLSNKLNEGSKTGLEKVSIEALDAMDSVISIWGNSTETDGVFISERQVMLFPYEIGKYEVTQELYNRVMGFNPSFYQGDDKQPAIGETQKQRPVERVSWFDAVIFCNELTKLTMTEEDCVYEITIISKENISDPNSAINSAQVTLKYTDGTPKKGYRLPTEAEWEFAARGGNPQDKTNWQYDYSGSNIPEDVGWFNNNSEEKTHEVGKLKANSLGIYDMSGNVLEWCWDEFAIITVPEIVLNPIGSGGDYQNRVRRGGSVGFNSTNTVTQRFGRVASSIGSILGFRICRSK